MKCQRVSRNGLEVEGMETKFVRKNRKGLRSWEKRKRRKISKSGAIIVGGGTKRRGSSQISE